MASFTRLIAIASLLVAMQDVNADPPETNYIPIQLLTVEQLNQIANLNWRNNFGDESLPIQCDDASFKTDEVGKIVSMKVSTLPWIVSFPPSVQKDIERDIDKQIRKKNPE